MDVLQVLFSLWTGNRCTTGQPESIKKLTAEEQQEAGKKLVEFFCVEKAQEMSDLLDMALPFSKVDVSYDNPLVSSTQSYIADGAVSSTYAFSRLLPSDFWSENGAVMQQYLTGMMDRDTAADAIQTYWQNQK